MGTGDLFAEDLFIKQLTIGPMMNYGYIIGDRSTKAAALIDPGFEGGRLADEAEAAGFRVTQILATHTHFDHAGDVRKLAGRFDCRVYVHKSEAEAFDDVADVVVIDDGDRIALGELEINVISTPGHSPGSVCFMIDSALFTGDTLFIDGIGRTDLAGGDTEKMFGSLARLRELPDKLVVFPGHHYGPAPTATLGEQKKTNPYLSCRSISDFFRIA